MRPSHVFGMALIFGFCLLSIPPTNAESQIENNYTFKVFLEDEEIGQQRFVVLSNGSQTTVQIEAQFKVKFWFLTAYSYRHRNTEVWVEDCLRTIRSETDDNGTTFFVCGTYADSLLKLVTHEGARSLNGCVKTFAYWNSDFMGSPELLNSQTGEMNRITVNELGEELITVKNQPTPTTHYQIVAEKFSIDLWYDKRGEWVALESTTKDDSRLRYELQ